MIPDKDLYFLCSKITQLRTATFTNFSTALLRFPVSVIEVYTTDDDGNLWFKVKKPYACIDDFEKTFPAQLHFYNKVKDYHIATHGKATIESNEKQSKAISLVNDVTPEQYAIIKFKILSAEYYYARKHNNNHLKDFLNNMINKILLHEDPILYRF